MWDAAYLTWSQQLWENSLVAVTQQLRDCEMHNSASASCDVPRLWPLNGPAQASKALRMPCLPPAPYVEGMSSEELPDRSPQALQLPARHSRAACVLSALTAYLQRDNDTVQALQEKWPDDIHRLQIALLVAVEQQTLLRLAEATAAAAVREARAEAPAAAHASGTAAAQPSAPAAGAHPQTHTPPAERVITMHVPPAITLRAASRVSYLQALLSLRALPLGKAAKATRFKRIRVETVRHDVGDLSEGFHVCRVQSEGVCSCARAVQLSSIGAWHSQCHGTRAYLDMVGAQVTPEGRLCVARNLCPVTLQAPIPESIWRDSMAAADWEAAARAWPEKRAAAESGITSKSRYEVAPTSINDTQKVAAETPLKCASEVADFVQSTVLAGSGSSPAEQRGEEGTPLQSLAVTGSSTAQDCEQSFPAAASKVGSDASASKAAGGTAGGAAGGALRQVEAVQTAGSDKQGDSSDSDDSVDSMQRQEAHPRYEQAFLQALRGYCAHSGSDVADIWSQRAAAQSAATTSVCGEEVLYSTGFPVHPNGSVVVRNSRGVPQTINVRREVLYLIDLALEHAAPGKHPLSHREHTHVIYQLDVCRDARRSDAELLCGDAACQRRLRAAAHPSRWAHLYGAKHVQHPAW